MKGIKFENHSNKYEKISDQVSKEKLQPWFQEARKSVQVLFMAHFMVLRHFTCNFNQIDLSKTLMK